MAVETIKRGPCVRCGQGGRYDETFVCEDCYNDPAMREELAWTLKQAELTGRDARTLIKAKHHWVGGWRA